MTKIEWTDETWNPVVGCSIVSPGCTKCYAMRMAWRLAQMGGKVGAKYAGLTRQTKVAAGPVWTGEVRLVEDALDLPLTWKRPRRIFVNSMSDLFHEALPDQHILRVLDIVRRCSWDGGSNCGKIAGEHTFQVLTKRPERAAAFMRRLRFNGDTLGDECALYLADDGPRPTILSNLWVGASVEDQRRADERREPMRAVADLGWLTWVSYEPALGPVDWAGWPFIRWLVSGGESGKGARPSHPGWHRAARDFCAAHSIAYLFKQWGEWFPDFERAAEHPEDDPAQSRFDTCVWNDQDKRWDDTPGSWTDPDDYVIATDYWQPEQPMTRIGKKRAGRFLEGLIHDAYPEPRA